jgi:hypothetical protein
MDPCGAAELISTLQIGRLKTSAFLRPVFRAAASLERETPEAEN